MSAEPTLLLSTTYAALYVLSGVSQPLLMTLASKAGLTDPTCQLYMFFYYLGPAAAVFTIRQPLQSSVATTSSQIDQFITTLSQKQHQKQGQEQLENSVENKQMYLKVAAIALLDIGAQTLNYTGSIMAGPTLFAIIYSSVTIWAAIYSVLILQRHINKYQWLGVSTVFCGLVITGFNALRLGRVVYLGSGMVVIGSTLHAMTYVLSEAVMSSRIKGGDSSSRNNGREQTLPVNVNCAIQGIVASTIYGLWQIVYTRNHFYELIEQPMKDAHTTATRAIIILLLIVLSNFLHSLTFFHTLKHFPGGATSAGVMKGLQAVLVFVFTSIVYCGRLGGNEMCFTFIKLMSLCVVVTGVLLYGRATEIEQRRQQFHQDGSNQRCGLGQGYIQIKDNPEDEEVAEDGGRKSDKRGGSQD